MSSTVFSEEIIELEYGRDADESYTSFVIDGGESYASDDLEIVTVSADGVLKSVGYGETYVHVIVDEKVIKSYLVIVYLVEEELTPFSNVKVLQPFIKGFPGNDFKPDQEVTIGEGATMLSRALNLKALVYLPSDIPRSHWAYEGVQGLMSHRLFFDDLNLNDIDHVLTRNMVKKFLENYSNQDNIVINEDVLLELSSDASLLRGEMVYYLCEAFNQERAVYSPPKFNDVNINHKYYQYIQQNYQ